MAISTFQAGKGINATKLNNNFSEIQNKANTNENNINQIASTALWKDGSNITQSIVDQFQQQTPVVLSNRSGSISLTDNKVHFLTLSANNNNKIVLPTPASDSYSHTIVLIVQGSNYSLNISNGTAGHLYNNTSVNTTNPYNVMYIWNKINNSWYYSLTQ